MDSNATISSALLEWVVGSFQLRRSARTVDDLNDGVLIWEMLQDIDPNYFSGQLPENDSLEAWVPRWQNLKHIHKILLSYLSEVCGHPSPNIGGTLDLQALAKDQSNKDLNLFLKLVLLAAISSSNTNEYVMRMLQMSKPTQETLKDIITEIQQTSYEDSVGLEAKYEGGTSNDQDLELAFEERVGKVIADNDRLQGEKKELQDLLDAMHDRHAHLQEKHDSIQRELEDSQERLSRLRSGAESVGSREEAKSKEQEHLIASLESKYTAAQEQIENLRKQNESLRLKGEHAQKLQDDFDEIKIERDQLLRKANAAEKYKQKLQQGQDWEKQNSLLQSQVEELKRQLRQSDSKHFTSSELEREIDEYKRMLPRIEQDRHELSEMKKRLEYDNHVLMAKLEHATTQHARDAATIEALRERIGGSDGPGTPTTPRASIPSFDEDSEAVDQLEKPDVDTTLKQASELDSQQEQILREAKLISEKESEALLATLQRKYEETGQLYDSDMMELRKEFADKIESSNRSTQRVIEYARRQMAVINNLRSELTSRPSEPESQATALAVEGPITEPQLPPPPAKEDNEQSAATTHELSILRIENENLTQELKLMTSAWYNLASRLQSPNVTVARGRGGVLNRAEMKSWLGRRRGEVERAFMAGGGGGGGR